MSLTNYIEKLQAEGKYSFSENEALEAFHCSRISLIHAPDFITWRLEAPDFGHCVVPKFAFS